MKNKVFLIILIVLTIYNIDLIQCSTSSSAQVWVTTLDQSILFEQQPNISFTSTPLNQPDIQITIDSSNAYQRIYGYGGALTQSSAYLFNQLLSVNESYGDQILRSLFDPEIGIGISMIRVPASACDFSLVNYTYDDTTGDINLDDLSIEVDITYTIPLLKRILSINPNIHLIFSPWSAPAWMKSSNNLNFGTLLESMYDVYTTFFIKFLTLYRDQVGININAITLQNEPMFQPMTYPGMLVVPSVATELVKLIGPKLKAANLTTQLYIYDHNWIDPDYPLEILSDPDAYQYVSATAFHCYEGGVSNQSIVYHKYPEKEIHMTECSGGYWAPVFSSDLVWASNNLYVGAMENWASSVLQWNFALDLNDGPTNHGCLNCRGFIKVDQNSFNVGSVDYNVEYYGTAHYNKFLSQPSYRIYSSSSSSSSSSSESPTSPPSSSSSSSSESPCYNSIAFKNHGDNTIHVVVLNNCDTSQSVSIYDQSSHQFLNYQLPIGLTTFYY